MGNTTDTIKEGLKDTARTVKRGAEQAHYTSYKSFMQTVSAPRRMK
jgi:hypothetical protein